MAIYFGPVGSYTETELDSTPTPIDDMVHPVQPRRESRSNPHRVDRTAIGLKAGPGREVGRGEDLVNLGPASTGLDDLDQQRKDRGYYTPTRDELVTIAIQNHDREVKALKELKREELKREKLKEAPTLATARQALSDSWDRHHRAVAASDTRARQKAMIHGLSSASPLQYGSQLPGGWHVDPKTGELSVYDGQRNLRPVGSVTECNTWVPTSSDHSFWHYPTDEGLKAKEPPPDYTSQWMPKDEDDDDEEEEDADDLEENWVEAEDDLEEDKDEEYEAWSSSIKARLQARTQVPKFVQDFNAALFQMKTRGDLVLVPLPDPRTGKEVNTWIPKSDAQLYLKLHREGADPTHLEGMVQNWWSRFASYRGVSGPGLPAKVLVSATNPTQSRPSPPSNLRATDMDLALERELERAVTRAIAEAELKELGGLARSLMADQKAQDRAVTRLARKSLDQLQGLPELVFAGPWPAQGRPAIYVQERRWSWLRFGFHTVTTRVLAEGQYWQRGSELVVLIYESFIPIQHVPYSFLKETQDALNSDLELSRKFIPGSE